MILPNVPIADYVADRVPGPEGVAIPPTLNSSVANLLLTRSARHAWEASPRLNPAWAPDDDRDFDLGTASHGVLLEGREIFVIDYPDYRSKSAQAVRDEAKAAGKLPALAWQAEAIKRIVKNARAKLDSCPDLEDIGLGMPEQTILWQHEGIWLRCRPDWLSADHRVIISLKTTRASAEPTAFMRTILGGGYDLQAAFELAGVKAATGIDATYVWLAVECAAPYAASLIGLSPEFREFAMIKFRKAVGLWTACLAENRWDGYPARIAYVDLPPWAQANFIERHGYDAPSVDDGRPLEEQMFNQEFDPTRRAK